VNRLVVVFVIGVALLTLGRYPAVPAQPKGAPVKWEYRVVSADQIRKLSGDGKDLSVGLNKLGEEGLELAAANGLDVEEQLRETTDPAEAARLRAQGTAVFVFKRAK